VGPEVVGAILVLTVTFVAGWMREFHRESEHSFDRIEDYLNKLQSSKNEQGVKHSAIKVKGIRK